MVIVTITRFDLKREERMREIYQKKRKKNSHLPTVKKEEKVWHITVILNIIVIGDYINFCTFIIVF